MKLAIIDHLDQPGSWPSDEINKLEKYLFAKNYEIFRATSVEKFKKNTDR